tara:strand:+ start:2723 stop:3025 length:303 start_codon:yes stop_codon:yes gene_type:complete
MKSYLDFPSPEEQAEEHQMIIPKSERVMPKSRTESEKVAITIEYFSSYLVWLNKLTDNELEMLHAKFHEMMIPSIGFENIRALRIMANMVKHKLGEDYVA